MKRHGGEGGDYKGQFPKRQRGDGYAEALANGKFELRFLVSTKSAGAVIGKGGENIKRLRSEFDAAVSVPDSSTPDRILTAVVALDNVKQFCSELLPKFEENGDGRREARLLVHQSHAGAIIGRAGHKIKELREETHAIIKVFSNGCPQSSDRVVQIVGAENVMAEAVNTIVYFIKEIPVKGQTRQYDATSYDPTIIHEYGGYPADSKMPGGRFGPPGGGMGRRGPPPARGGMGGMGPMGGPGMRGPIGGGPGGPAPYGGSSLGGPMGGLPPQMGPMSGGMGPVLGAGGMGAPFQPYPPQHGPPNGNQVRTTQVTIPSELGGTIIGRGGERINRIREESGAQIQLEPSNGQEERIITITGNEQQIHNAQYLLQQCVRSSLQQGGGRKYNQ